MSQTAKQTQVTLERCTAAKLRCWVGAWVLDYLNIYNTGRSLRTGFTHGAVRGPSDGQGWGLGGGAEVALTQRDEARRVEVQQRPR